MKATKELLRDDIIIHSDVYMSRNTDIIFAREIRHDSYYDSFVEEDFLKTVELDFGTGLPSVAISIDDNDPIGSLMCNMTMLWNNN